MVYPSDTIINAVIVSAISFLIIFLITPPFIKYLNKKGKTVVDYHKPGKPLIPRPAGPVLLMGIVIAEILFLNTGRKNHISNTDYYYRIFHWVY